MTHTSGLALLSALLVALSACAPSPTASPAAAIDGAMPTLSLGSVPPLACDDRPGVPVTDREVRQAPAFDPPAARRPFRDPVFGTCVVRVTDSQSDLPSSDQSGGMKNEYSRVQSFNADGSLLLARSIEANWTLYDARTLAPLRQVPLFDEPRWDATDPFLIYHIDELKLLAYNVNTGHEWVVHDFSGAFPGQTLAATWTRYEGSPSHDGRYWGLMAQDEEWSAVGFLIYDRVADEIVATRQLPPCDVDSVTISPLGAHFLAAFDEGCEAGTFGDDGPPCGLMVYDRDLQNGRGLLRIVGHFDTALDADGREILVYQDIDTDAISMLDLATGTATSLWPIDFGHTPIGLHFSGRAFDRPGWALVSTYSGGHPVSHTWMDNQVFAIELRPGGRVLRLAHTHSIVDEDQEHDYWAEPHASANQDLTRVVFTSNWGRSGTDDVEMYLIEVPPEWLEP